MSSYGYTHIGFFITGKEREVTDTEMVRVCGNDSSHTIEEHAKFCPECGTKIIDHENVIVVTPDIYDIPQSAYDGELYDELYFPEYIAAKGHFVAISNYGLGRFSIDDDDSQLIVLDNIQDDIEDQYNQFMDKHDEHIKLLSKYVYDDVEVKYGIFRYYM